MIAPQPRTRIVVLGGGVGGLAAARHLDRQFDRSADVEVTLVSRDNFFLLSPLRFEACAGVLELRHCAQPIRPCVISGIAIPISAKNDVKAERDRYAPQMWRSSQSVK